ncbi:MAG: alpha/beta fold hydrolase [Candidatus Korobacteraceae bacterium]
MIVESFPPRLPDPVRALYPFRTRYLRLQGDAPGSSAGGEMMSFVDEGPEAAPPLLLLHGNLTWSFLFRELIARARGRFRVIAPDLVGFGLSSKPRDPGCYTFEGYGEHLFQLISELNLRKLTLVLHDCAGPIGIRYAMRCPENVGRIVLVNSWADARVMDLADRLPFWLAAARSRWTGSLLRQWRLTPWPALQWAVAKRLAPAVAAGYGYPFRNPRSRTAPLALARLLRNTTPQAQLAAAQALAPKLKAVRTRVQILWGECDPLFRSKLLPYLLRDSLPNCGEPVFVAGASHLLPEDAPELLAEKVMETAPRRQAEPVFNIL